ncbi:MAG: hypothetical protein AAGA70_17610 [Pseudomonadota bacterium]
MDSSVSHRRVLFLPGFDPAPARAHRERYRREGAAQAEISGYEIAVSSDPAQNPHAWQVRATIDGHETQAQIDVLVWSDLVRAAMEGGISARYLQMLRTAWRYIGSGAIWRLMRLRKGPVIAALYPVAALLLQAAIAVIIGAAASYLAFSASERAMIAIEGDRSTQSGFLLRAGSAALLALWVTWRLLRLFKDRDGWFLAHYLMQDYAYTAARDGAYPPELSDRLAGFTEKLIAASGAGDEVLLVGHSSGAYLAVTVLADALRSGRVAEAPRIGLLTLGQVVPMASFLPRADRLRADLAYLAASECITWVDVTAPGDGCAFALCDPVAVSGVAPARKLWPRVISAAFSQTLQPQTWARLRWRFFRLHFQYLCAFDRPGDYDYFAITAGPQSLGDRFAGRAASASRIEAPVNRYRSMAA